jgi:hypothetical protein
VEQARVGAALHIHLPGGDAGSPDVIVESYFSAANTAGDSARLIGQSASGDNFDYNSAAGTTANLGGGSASSAVVPQALGTTAIFFGSAGWGSLAPLAGIVGGIAVLNALEDKGEAPRSLASYTGADVHAMTPAQVAALSSADPAAFSSADIAALGADIVALGTDFGFLSTAAIDALSAGQLGAIIQAQRGALLARDYADPLASGTRMQLLSTELAQVQDATSADGTANGSTPLANYINRVTGTDVVSSAEYAAGFTIRGRTTAGLSSGPRFYLDNNWENGVNEIGTELVSGSAGASTSYNSATGEFSVTFTGNAAALRPGTHDVASSGVHRLTVDADGNGSDDGVPDADRLFLVASGTAISSDTGLVSQNRSVQDTASQTVFVYYFGDPDGDGVGLWTQADPVGVTDQYGDNLCGGDWNCYAAAQAEGYNLTSANPQDAAMRLVTDIGAQVWEFAASPGAPMTWPDADAAAGNHTATNSNTSRLMSLQEALAL